MKNENDKAGLPVSPSVTPDGSQGTGQRPHFVSPSCAGERCGPCFRAGPEIPATHKLGEEFAPADSAYLGHNLTQYVCCYHFAMIVGPRSAQMFRGCGKASVQSPTPQQEPKKGTEGGQ